MCAPAPHPASPRGLRTVFVAVIILFAGYGLLALATIPVVASTSRRDGAWRRFESGTPPWRSALSRQTAAASWRCRFFTSKRNNLCGGKKMSNLWAYRHPARPPRPPSFTCPYQILDFNSRALCLRVEAFHWVSSGIWRREPERKLRKLESSERIIARLYKSVFFPRCKSAGD